MINPYTVENKYFCDRKLVLSHCYHQMPASDQGSIFNIKDDEVSLLPRQRRKESWGGTIIVNSDCILRYEVARYGYVLAVFWQTDVLSS